MIWGLGGGLQAQSGSLTVDDDTRDHSDKSSGRHDPACRRVQGKCVRPSEVVKFHSQVLSNMQR